MSNPLAVFVDGVPCDQDWPLDRGLHYGDGLFETVIARNGRIRFEALHQQRLASGCQRLGMPMPRGLWEQARALAHQFGHALLKLILTRGSAMQRGYGVSGQEQGRPVLLVYPAPDPVDPAEVSVDLLQARLGENPLLAGIKHCNRLEQVLARMQLQPGAFEGLMVSSSGRLISGTMSNVFLDTEAGLVTPALNLCGVAGVLRAVVLREAAAMGTAVRVADLPLAVLQDCRGLFLTNVRLGVLPVTRLDGRALALSDHVRALAHRVAALES